LTEAVTWDLGKRAVAECQRISDRLRGARNADELRTVADEERENVQTIAADPQSKPLARNIADLKNYMLKNVKE